MLYRLLIIACLFFGPTAFAADTPCPMPTTDKSAVATAPASTAPATFDFSNYEYPLKIIYKAPPLAVRLIDVFLLVILLGAGTWALLAHKSRIFFLVPLGVGLLYFGFIKHGCICPVGATGNVIAVLTRSDVAISATTALMFFIPLLFALFVGRVFCGVACPLGAVQEFIAFRPLPIPRMVDLVLQTLKFLALGMVIFYAVANASSFICRHDPFIAVFRLDGHRQIWIATAIFLLICVFIKRPFCRYLCPYGVLLELCSLAAFRRLKIDAERCNSCKNCEKKCPVGNIKHPKIGKANCISCGTCVNTCPKKAISHGREENKKSEQQ